MWGGLGEAVGREEGTAVQSLAIAEAKVLRGKVWAQIGSCKWFCLPGKLVCVGSGAGARLVQFAFKCDDGGNPSWCPHPNQHHDPQIPNGDTAGKHLVT